MHEVASSHLVRNVSSMGFADQVDAVIIGGYFGKKARGGKIGEYLLALADGSADTGPSSFVSFAR